MSGVRLARGLTLDADYVGGGTFALLAKKGAGKTYAMRVLAEEFWAAKVPFVALDPMDAFWGLRSSADGDGEGIPVAIFGGPHGDAPLEASGGRLMADLVVDERLSMVLSTRHFGSRAAEREFAMAFLERLYRRNSELVHLLIDEADLFAPQKPRDKDSLLLAITENIVRRGRNNGIGVTMATQRPAVLNKDVLTQVDGLVVMRMLGPNDRNAIDDWVGEHGDTGQGRDVKGTLPDLDTGEAWVWVPELGVLERTKIRASRTFDSSPTRRRGTKSREPKSYADIDVEAIEKRMADTIARAKAEDPRELRKQIATLRRELAAKPAGEPTERVVEKPVEVLVEVPAISDEQIEELREIATAMRDLSRGLSARADQIEEALRHVRAVPARGDRSAPALDRGATSPHRKHAERPSPRPRPEPRRQPDRAAPAPAEDVRVSGPQQRILNALAALETIGLGAAAKTQLALFAEASPKSSAFTNNLGSLRSSGLIDYPGPGRVALTDAGRELADASDAPQTVEELHGYVFRLVGGAKSRILGVLIAAYENDEVLTKAELADRAGASATSSAFTNNLGSLRSLGLIDYPGPGLVEALPVLFLEAAA